MEDAGWQLARLGLFGKPLTNVPQQLAEEAQVTGLGEIVPEEEALGLAHEWTLKPFMNVFMGDLGTLQNPDKYRVRLKTEEWRRIVLKNLFKDSQPIYLITSALVLAENGCTKEQLKTQSEVRGVSKYVRALINKGLVTADEVDGATVYRYNFNFDPQAAANKANRSPDRTTHATSEKRMNQASSSLLQKNQMTNFNYLEQQVNVRQARSTLDGLSAPVLLDTFAMELGAPTESLARFIAASSKEHGAKLWETAEGTLMVVPQNIPQEERDRLIIDFAASKRIFLLSDHLEDFAGLNPAYAGKKGQEAAIKLLAGHGLVSTEVPHKYVPCEYVVSPEGTPEEDPILQAACSVAANRTREMFREKVRRFFCFHPAFHALDNGYEPGLSVQAKLFYDFIMREVDVRSGHFLLDKGILTEMEFGVFSGCIELGQERLLFQLAAVVLEFFSEDRLWNESILRKWMSVDPEQKALTVPSAERVIELSHACADTAVEHIALYRWCRAILSDLPVGDVIRAAAHCEERLASILRSRVNVNEFAGVMALLRARGILSVSEDTDYIHLRLVENTNDLSIIEDTIDEAALPGGADLPVRLEIVKHLEGLEPEDFRQSARAALRELELAPAIRSFYLARVRRFK